MYITETFIHGIFRLSSKNNSNKNNMATKFCLQFSYFCWNIISSYVLVTMNYIHVNRIDNLVFDILKLIKTNLRRLQRFLRSWNLQKKWNWYNNNCAYWKQTNILHSTVAFINWYLRRLLYCSPPHGFLANVHVILWCWVSCVSEINESM